jgi:hypothetical protein
MTLAELIAEVYTITGRSDRVAETLSAVKSATLKAHQSDYYYKDIFETGLDFGYTAYIQSLDYRAIIPRWRALKYIRKYDPDTSTPGKFLELIVPENVLDLYAVQKTDICYAAGAYIQIKTSTEQRYYLLGCYLNPDITETGFNSWVALDHPYCIVFDAAATVFKAIGKDEEAAAYRTLVAEQLTMLRTANILATGF